MNDAATKIQRAFKKRVEGRSLMVHLKDLMKKLMEGEKAKGRLTEVLVSMEEETGKYFKQFLIKNMVVRDFCMRKKVSSFMFRMLSKSKALWEGALSESS